MAEKITELTQAQKDSMPQFAKKWIDIGLSTDPIDHEKAKAAVALAYQKAGLNPPSQYMFFDSPKAGLREAEKYGGTVSSAIYGSHEASWVSFYDFFNHHFGLAEQIKGIAEVVKNCGWLWVFEDLAIITERPVHIKFDEQDRLHNEKGPAILYKDGFGVYAWHGTRIPGKWIEEGIDAKTAITWGPTAENPNATIEQRRCACEILGWAKILKELNAKIVDQDGDPEIGTLLEVDLPGIGKEKFIRVQCGTKREFALPVPPTTKTALEAQAWMVGLDETDFMKPEVRT